MIGFISYMSASPGEAAAGALVTIQIGVQNMGGSSYNLAVTAKYDSTSFSFTPSYSLASPGQVVYFSGTFTMPAKDVQVVVQSWHWDGSQWIQDDTGTLHISLAQAATPTISVFQILDYTKV
jgi:hypothetical protein